MLTVLTVLALSWLPVPPLHAQPPTNTSNTSNTSGTSGGQDAPASAQPTLDALLKKIGGKPNQQARFVEKKYFAVLDAPVQSSGLLRYQAPGRLEKITEQPRKESMMLDGDLLIMERDGRQRTVPASQIPGVAALVGGLRDTLGGDAQALRRVFKVVVQGNDRQWQVDLLPSDVTSAQLVSRITLRGQEDQLLEVETLQADGDRSVMTLTPA